MKIVSSLLVCGALVASMGAFAQTAPAASAAQPAQTVHADQAGGAAAPGMPQKFNNAQVAIVKKVMVERYKSNIALLQSGLGCMQKVVTQDQLQACMASQQQEAMADQKKSLEYMKKMEKDLKAAAK